MLFNTVSFLSCSAAEVPATETDSAYMTQSNWIWSSDTVTANSISYFRHEYELKDTPVSMSVRVSAHNHLKFYVNGNIITGYVSPAPTSLPNNIYYLEYEYTGEKLNALLGEKPTELALAAAVQYMGNHGMNYINGKPAFWGEITLAYADGSSETLKTDTSWRALSDTPYANGTPKMSGRGMNMQIDYDAQKMSDALEWTYYGYDEASYESGTWTNAVSADAETQSYKMRKQTLPEGVIHESITPTPASKQDVGYQVFDTGRIVSGFVRFKLSAPAGTRVYIRYSERLNSDGTLHQATADESATEYRDFYTFAGEGVEEFVADFDYKAFRYFEIVGMPELVDASDFTVEWASTGIKHTASFVSSNETLNKIYQACINTQINNILGMPVDCPHREQSQYIADAQMQYDLLSYAFTNMSELSYKTLLDFASSQFDIGIFTFVAPSQAYAGLYTMHIPEWDLRYSDILLTYYKTSGDTVGLAEFYDNAAANVAYWEKGIDSTGLMHMDYGIKLWHIADHPGPKVNTSGDYSTVCNLLLYDSYRDLCEVATILGKSDDAKLYEEKAEALLDAINGNLLDPDTGLYIDSYGVSEKNPGVSAMAINVGATPDYLIPSQVDYIANSSLQTNVVLTWEVMNALLNYGDADAKEACYDLILDIYTKMADGGTVWESVLNTNASHSHAWNAFPAKMLHRYFLGVEYAGVNYTDIEIRPYLPEALDTMSGTLTIPDDRGSIDVSLSRADGILTLDVESAESALVGVPRAKNASTVIKLDGETVFANATGSDAQGITYVSNDAEYVYFNVDAGAYSFTSEAAEAAAEGEFDVVITATEGGSISVNSGEATREYTATVSAGESITVEAVADYGYKFTGFTGTYGSPDDTFTLTVGSDVYVTASFEISDPIKRYINIAAPENSGLKVVANGKTYSLPTTVATEASNICSLAVENSENALYDFAAWTGDIYSGSSHIEIPAGKHTVKLEVIGSFCGNSEASTDPETGAAVNIALGATVTSENVYIQANRWLLENLVDGRKYKADVASTYHGLTSNAYASQDISSTPHEIVIDLGENKYMDTAVIWPRVDNVEAGAENDCFPESYTVSVKADGEDEYTTVASVTDGGNPCGKSVTVEFDNTAFARYVKLSITKLGKGTVESGSTLYRVQLAELELFMNGELPESAPTKTLTVNGNGSILVNGTSKDLPYTATYAPGTRLALAPVNESGVDFVVWSGDIKTSQTPLYLTMNNDIAVNAEYSQNVISVSDNLVYGMTATIPSSAVTVSTGTWEIAKLTDGVKGGNGGFTSAGYSSATVTDSNLYLEFDFSKNTDFSRVVMYPRQGVSSNLGSGTSANFPAGFDVQYKLDGSSTWVTVAQFTDIPNPNGNPAVFDFDHVNARYLRIKPTAIGAPASDAPWEYRVQFAELEVCATNLMNENLATGATVSADSTLESSGAWGKAYLNDGVTAYKSGSTRGYTSDSLSQATVSTTPFKIELALTAEQKINELILYPRTDAKNASGTTPNFPKSYYIEAYDSTKGEYVRVYTALDTDNPNFKPVYCIFDEDITTSKVRICVTELGEQPTDEALYRVQFAEVKLGYVEGSGDTFDTSATVALTPASVTLENNTDTVEITATVTGVSGDDAALVFSIEDEYGFPADFAELGDFSDRSASAKATDEGEAYAVVRLASKPQIMAKIPLASTVKAVLYGDVDADGGVAPVDAVVLSRHLAEWTRYSIDTIDATASDVNANGSVDTADGVILSRHLASWSGYEYLPYRA
ncbi:MAG: family 78 glycoside hydrolase catalytic domain [Clostridia bacterium]|nr:family 78 glycoside hydrolase catalytic domain [Clostridia bacterium]